MCINECALNITQSTLFFSCQCYERHVFLHDSRALLTAWWAADDLEESDCGRFERQRYGERSQERHHCVPGVYREL